MNKWPNSWASSCPHKLGVDVVLHRFGGHLRSEEKERRKVFHMAKDNKHNLRRRHTPEFKAGVVQLVRSGAKTVGGASRDLGLADSLIRTWMERAEPPAESPTETPLTASEKEELKHLRREVKVLRMEREILKRAATFFAKETA